MAKILIFVTVFSLSFSNAAQSGSRWDEAKSDAFRLEGALMSVGIYFKDLPGDSVSCEVYSKNVMWKGGETTSALNAIDMMIERWGAGPHVPVDPMSVAVRAQKAAQDKTEKMEEAVVHPYKLQEWRIQRALIFERCGSDLDGRATDGDLEAAYWLFRAANNPPAYQRVADTLMNRLHAKGDPEVVRWMCRRTHTYRQADQCDTMDADGSPKTKEVKR